MGTTQIDEFFLVKFACLKAGMTSFQRYNDNDNDDNHDDNYVFVVQKAQSVLVV